MCLLSRFRCVQLFVTPWTIACQALLSMGILQAKNTGVGCHTLLQGIFPTQGLNPAILHCRQILNACNVGDPSLIPGSGRSSGESIGYQPQYSWASLVAQLVKSPPAMRRPGVQSLGWEDPLEKGIHCSILATIILT